MREDTNLKRSGYHSVLGSGCGGDGVQAFSPGCSGGGVDGGGRGGGAGAGVVAMMVVVVGLAVMGAGWGEARVCVMASTCETWRRGKSLRAEAEAVSVPE